MIDISALKLARLVETPPGALFVPVAEGGSHFLAGRVNDFAILVALDGDQPFTASEPETWSRAPGLVVEGGRFEVDVMSGQPIQSERDPDVGALVLGSCGVMLIAKSRNGRHAVLLDAGKGPTSIQRGDVAFAEWRYVTGEGDTLIVHFESKAGAEEIPAV